MPTLEHDVLIVGGGPAGLTAAIYLSRFHLRTMVVDNGRSRALMIPVSHNHAGYPDGISGERLLGQMREQASQFGTQFVDATLDTLTADGELFIGTANRGTAGEQLRARSVLIATGVFNHRPPMDEALHAAAVASGRLRYCPICDGYEVTDKRLAVIGTGERGFNEAIFLRGYTRDITLIAPDARHDLDGSQRATLEESGIIVVDGPASGFALAPEGLRVATAGGAMLFDSVYPALGSAVHSQLAAGLGAKTTGSDCIIVDTHQRTSVAGLYAAGDVVIGLDQISHAMGEGGVAATTIRNDLAKRAPVRR